ncbi:TspO/MBR family protein [Solicola sp. PLA-1-18]|uniref:TspO/MBR family protein n=1 Tax=Solicola sp. PLA-1-18 TaxID=3380532 RepID=UPI003B805AAA
MTQTATRTRTRPACEGRSVLVLLGFLAATFVVAGLGSLATLGAVDGWYVDAAKPPFNPPNAVFGPVWTVLYAAMAVAAWLVWRRRDAQPAEASTALRLWWVQLVVNLAWTPTFFGAELLWPGLVVIVVLDVLVAWTLLANLRVSKVAAGLFVPYLAWVLFATALNASIAYLN